MLKNLSQKFPLINFILSRVVTMVVLLFLLGFALFGLMELAPGDIVDQMMTQQIMAGAQGDGAKSISNNGQENIFSEQQLEKTRAELGLDKPFYIQYFKWLKRVIFEHDLGVSLISRAPVSFLLGSRLINTLILNLISLVLITFFSFGYSGVIYH